MVAFIALNDAVLPATAILHGALSVVVTYSTQRNSSQLSPST